MLKRSKCFKKKIIESYDLEPINYWNNTNININIYIYDYTKENYKRKMSYPQKNNS